MSEELNNEDWYNGLITDCKAIAVERGFNSRFEVILGKWELGERIKKDTEYKKHSKKGNVVKQLAKDIGCSESNLYFCIQFYDKYPKSIDSALESFGDEGKAISWYKITQKYLGERVEEPELAVLRKTFRLSEIYDAFSRWYETSGLEISKLPEELDKFRAELEKPRKE